MFDVNHGNGAKFIVNFRSSTGATVTPSSAQVTMTYQSGGVSTTTAVPLSLNGTFWVGTWDTTPADLGIANWAAISAASSLSATGVINVIDP